MRPHPSVKPEGTLEPVAEVREFNADAQTTGANVKEAEGDGDEKDDADNREREMEEEKTQQRERPKKLIGQKTADEKWEETLDHKIRPLLEAVDVVEYGGRDVEE
jgi:hypothetical protein